MSLPFAILLSALLGLQLPEKWQCRGDLVPISKEDLQQVPTSKLKASMVTCAIPHLPSGVDAKGTVVVEVQVDEQGSVRCARAVSGHPIVRTAAVEAAMKWKFKPLKIWDRARPFKSVLPVVVHWDAEVAAKQCPEEKRKS